MHQNTFVWLLASAFALSATAAPVAAPVAVEKKDTIYPELAVRDLVTLKSHFKANVADCT